MNIEYPIRLQSYLAKSGFGSRRSCEQLITDGRVSINLKKVRELGTKVEAEDIVQVDGILAEVAENTYYYALHKPRGYICSNYDPNEEKYARDLITIRDRHLLFHIGRLDKDSSGLILYTNDGDTAFKVTHPSFGIEKEYAVMTKEPILVEDMKQALKGVMIDSKLPYKINKFDIKTKKWVYVTLTEGKNREIRKLFEALGYQVVKLVRLRIGPIELGDLKEGDFRPLKKWELDGLLKGAKK